MPDDNAQRVRTREFDWEQLVKNAWGKEWNKPDVAYEFSGGRKFEEPREGGPYGEHE